MGRSRAAGFTTTRTRRSRWRVNCERGSMRVVYRLRDDKRQIERVQKSTLTTEQFGIEPTHGLFGSGESWAKMSSGELPVHTCCGVITKCYMASMNDWPEFTMRSDSGEETNWSRYGHSGEDKRYYQVGRRVEVDYVLQPSRANALDIRAESKTVVEVRIDVPPESIRERIVRFRSGSHRF
jgi:hypothetical protein